MEKVYLVLLEYVWDKKILVNYVYILYKLLNKYPNLPKFIEKISQVDTKLAEILKFFEEEKYSTKDIYVLLQYIIDKTWINVLEIEISSDINLQDFNLDVEGDIILKEKDDDVWVKIKTADSKIYKRFLLEDVKKILKLGD